jgi:L-ascorbate metabolism protein UlaG (beta-lactamase superfamily)
MGRFEDRATRPARGPRDLLRWRVIDPLLGRSRPSGGSALPFVPPTGTCDHALLGSEAASLTWVGHASFVVRLGGQLVATDPIWSERISGLIPRLAPPGVALERLPPIDVVTLSHNHYDHLDLPTLRRIGPQATYVVPLGNARFLAPLGLPRVIELDWWQSHRIGSLTVTLVPARHWSMRAPWNRNDALWGGFVLEGPEGRAYHAGDTALFDGFVEIGRRFGPIDWALLPIGAYEPRWFMEPQHMNPDDALVAFERLEARHFVAMHWGTFKLTDEPLDEPPARIRSLWQARGFERERLWLLGLGETRALARASTRVAEELGR